MEGAAVSVLQRPLPPLVPLLTKRRNPIRKRSVIDLAARQPPKVVLVTEAQNTNPRRRKIKRDGSVKRRRKPRPKLLIAVASSLPTIASPHHSKLVHLPPKVNAYCNDLLQELKPMKKKARTVAFVGETRKCSYEGADRDERRLLDPYKTKPKEGLWNNDGDVKARLWLMDTGSPFDLLSKVDMTQYEIQTTSKCPPCEMFTANGLTSAGHKANVEIQGLPEEGLVNPYVLPTCPAVLSLGRRCVQMGYMFIWEPYSNRPPSG